MHTRLTPALLALASALAVNSFAAPPTPPIPPPPRDLSRHYWPAVWITAPHTSSTGYGVYHFRKTFDLPVQPATFLVRVSADNRYRLFVNGVSVRTGPERGDPMHWRFETVDLAPHLHAGRNVIAALVWNAATSRPTAQLSVRTGFLLQGETPAEEIVDTNSSWRAYHDLAYTPEPLDRAALHAYIVVGDGDRIDGQQYPWGWETPDYDDSAWTPAAKTGDAVPYGQSTDLDWWLVPGTLPAMEETPQRLQRVRRATGIEVSDRFLAGTTPVTIPAHTHVTALFDQTFETNAYPVVIASGGRGSAIKLTYAEALVDAAGAKGNRNDVENRRCIGKSDVFLPDGGTGRRFTTLWFRTYRYVEMEVTTGDEPVTIQDLSGIFTGYPFEQRGHFASDDPELTSIWNVGWRTARLCAYETYFDCPYYEQLQYVGDTRIQGLISLDVAGDDRLLRNAIALFDDSRIAEGLTQSRYPSASTQVINTFSLYWIEMVRDYWMHRNDPAFIQARLTGVRDVLGWFERHVDPATGLLGPLPYWGFVDWAPEWPWSAEWHMGGEPVGGLEGNSAIITLQYALTLQDAAEMCDAFGDPSLAARYRREAAALRHAVKETCWDPARRYFADTPAKTEFSQHVNALAVLAGAIVGADARDLMARTIADPSLIQCTLYFRFYLLRAMKRAGLGDQYLASLGPWKDMLARGLTTFAEKPDPTRSDCHAWSASPCYEFLATVCGIEPASPSFKTVRIEPHLGSLQHATGSVPTPWGDVRVEYQLTGDRLRAQIVLPAAMTGTFHWHDRTTALHPGSQILTL